MLAKKSKTSLHLQQFMRSHNIDRTQLAIILGFLLVATLASLWLPAYFVGLVLNGL